MARPPRLEVPALSTTSRRGATSAGRSFATTPIEGSISIDSPDAGERFRFELLAYCLMTNHVHLAIRTGPQPLSQIMGRLH